MPRHIHLGRDGRPKRTTRAATPSSALARPLQSAADLEDLRGQLGDANQTIERMGNELSQLRTKVQELEAANTVLKDQLKKSEAAYKALDNKGRAAPKSAPKKATPTKTTAPAKKAAPKKRAAAPKKKAAPKKRASKK